MLVNVKLEITGLEGGVIARHKHDDGTYVLEMEQERFVPFKVKIITPSGTEEYEVVTG